MKCCYQIGSQLVKQFSYQKQYEAKNYRPIACQNITYKIYTGITNNFLKDHCSINDIITLEQAEGKKDS